MRHAPHLRRAFLTALAGAVTAPVLIGTTTAVADEAVASPTCGRSIAYVVVLEDSPTLYDLYSIPAAGGTPPTLLYGGPSSELDPAWSPNGRRLAFATRGEDPAAPRHIWVMRPGRTEPRQLTTVSEGNNRYPTWSPDGSMIAYTAGVDPTGPTRIRVMNADGTGDHEIFALEGANLSYTRWSPDGSRLVFTITRDEFAATDLGMVDVDGSNFEQLTEDGRTDFADWASADSLVLTHMAESRRRSSLYLADDRVEQMHRITRLPGHADRVDVSRSGRRMVFDNWGRGFDGLMITRIDGSDARAITEEPGSYAYTAWQSRARCS